MPEFSTKTDTQKHDTLLYTFTVSVPLEEITDKEFSTFMYFGPIHCLSMVATRTQMEQVELQEFNFEVHGIHDKFIQYLHAETKIRGRTSSSCTKLFITRQGTCAIAPLSHHYTPVLCSLGSVTV